MAVEPTTDRISIFGQGSQDAIINNKWGNMAMNPVNVLTEVVYFLV